MNPNSIEAQTNEIQFPTESPINKRSIAGQNKVVYDHMNSGKTINCIEALSMGVMNLHSRISDLRNVHDVPIKDKFVNIGTGKSLIKQYWIENNL